MSKQQEIKKNIRYDELLMEAITGKLEDLDLTKSLRNCDNDILPVHGLTLYRVLNYKDLHYLATDGIISKLLAWVGMSQCVISYDTVCDKGTVSGVTKIISLKKV